VIQDISVTHDKRLGREPFRDFDLAAYAKKTFRSSLAGSPAQSQQSNGKENG